MGKPNVDLRFNPRLSVSGCQVIFLQG